MDERTASRDPSDVRGHGIPVLARLTRTTRPNPRLAGYVVAVAGTALVTTCFLPIRDDITPLSNGFAYLVVVVVAAAATGSLGPGITASIVGFLAFNFAFLPPYGPVVDRPARSTWRCCSCSSGCRSSSLGALRARGRTGADAAEAREGELRSLQELSRDLIVQGPGDETYRALLEHVVGRFGFAAGALFVQEQGSGLVERMTVGAEPGTVTPSWDPSSPGRAPERLPLSVGNRNLGLIVLVGDRGPLEAPEGRVIRAVCDQLALVLERDRLLRTATDAEIFKQTDQIRRSMLAAVSHDLRSPLAAIKASVTDLMDPDVRRTDEERADVLQTIDAETDRLDTLVANLLDMSRIEAGVLKARTEPVDVAETTAESADPALGASVATSTSEPSIEPEAARARADPVFLVRVLSNLLDNAAKVASKAARPDVQVRSADARTACVAIRVIDSRRRAPTGADAGTALLPVLSAGGADLEPGTRTRPRDREGVRRSHGWRALDRGHARRWRDLRVLAAPRGGRAAEEERILVVDDEAQIRKALNRALGSQGIRGRGRCGRRRGDRSRRASPPTWSSST